MTSLPGPAANRALAHPEGFVGEPGSDIGRVRRPAGHKPDLGSPSEEAWPAGQEGEGSDRTRPLSTSFNIYLGPQRDPGHSTYRCSENRCRKLLKSAPYRMGDLCPYCETGSLIVVTRVTKAMIAAAQTDWTLR